MKIAIAVYAALLGLSIIGLWIMLLLSGQVPELETEPAGIALHMAAEGVMALALLLSASLLFSKHRHAVKVFLLSAGMTVYAVINASGYYVEQLDLVMTGLFTVVLVLTVLASLILVRSETRPDRGRQNG